MRESISRWTRGAILTQNRSGSAPEVEAMPDETQRQAERERPPRIAILGAGPAGLAAGYFLKRHGYKDVMIFEKLGRVGGLCKSVTDGYMAFDLGGTYITPAYHETLKIARVVRAERYRGKSYEMVKVVKDDQGKKSLKRDDAWGYARRGLGDQAEPIGIVQLVRGVFAFWWQRRKVRRYVDTPSFERVHERKDLCVSFGAWLDSHDIGFMRRLFEIPVTMMGYGFLDEVAAPYVLKYMAPGTYWSMFLRGLPFVGLFWAWPQRFREGFQRMWERVSWGLNVRMDVRVLGVRRQERRELPIELDVETADHLYPHEEGRTRRTLCFDKLIIACPLTREVLEQFIALRDDEAVLFERIHAHTYVQNTLHAVTVDSTTGEEKPFKLFAPVVPVFPFDETTFGKPWVVVQVWGNQSRLLQFYSRIDPEGKDARSIRTDVEAASHELLHLLKDSDTCATPVEAGSIPGHERLQRWSTYDRWPYFSHVSAEDMAGGFFSRLDAIQSIQNTYYTGGAATFEMVEAVVRHAKYIAEKVHRDLRKEAFPKPRRVPFGMLHPPYAEAERLVE
jgi:hypothetical protein